ncbi:2Fe-2S iron-sulfur cluster binding domain-containing protein [Aestuariibacter sp. GS-14]|uniref:2Fe-2S iron-sulfur cluster-binding protein n=1 Tax=Aestuariibacter sp. GS-14 TaxID=2590670 RepID=UPI0011284E24|nr:2Fe-2S iron-sulfur cluster-binding protein [Aestuariibacter sp. GS-14]TPV61929.1 2Fe-2S iron-sulfur cluster binding domain-containing protein [Aestuariibacter sp. GS-14]
MPFRIEIANTQDYFLCGPDESLLHGMVRYAGKGIPVGCRGGGCGVCKIEVIAGEYQTKKMSAQHVSTDELSAGIVLACKVFPDSDMTIDVIGKCKYRIEKCGATQSLASNTP